MKIEETKIQGLFQISYNYSEDVRGEAAKVFCQELIRNRGIEFKINDLFYSISNKNVIRGMHVQTSPFEQKKLVYVVNGEIVDVVIDLRPESKTFRQYEVFQLSNKNKQAIFIPEGCAHGFKAIKDNTITIYAISGEYSKAHDKGIHYNSFGYNWGEEEMILSSRDKMLPKLEQYICTNICD